MASRIIIFALIFLIVSGVGLYLYDSGQLISGLNYLKSSLPTSTLSIGGQGGGGGNAGGGYGTATSTTITAASSSEAASSSAAGASSSTAPAAPAAPTNPNLINPQIPSGFTANDLSPYFKEIVFGGMSPGPVPGLGVTGYGEITLYANYGNPSTTIDVTGWEIKTNRGGEYVPQAVDIYDPLGLNPATDIRMERGDQLNIYSSSAPVNLRLNECIGYLPNRNQFNPELPQTCPYISSAGLNQFSGQCENYILSLNGCQSPDFSNPQIPAYDYACKQYLTNRFNYKWCFDTYFSDPNFLSNQIEVWTGSSPLDQYHDNVELLDRKGLLVDYYSY